MSALRHSFSFDPDAGSFAIEAGRLRLTGACAQVLLEVQDLDTVLLDVASDDTRPDDEPVFGPGTRRVIAFAPADGRGVTLDAFTPDRADAVLLRLSVHNASSESITVHELLPLVITAEGSGVELGSPSDEWAVLREGWHSWSPVAVRAVAGSHAASPGEAPEGWADHLMATVATHEPRPAALLVGWVESARMFGRVFVAQRGDTVSIRATAEADGIDLRPGETLTTEPLVVHFADSPHAALDAYGLWLGRRMKSLALADSAAPANGTPADAPPVAPAVRRLKNPSGWNSWYSGLGPEVSAKAVLRNLDLYKASGKRWPLGQWVVDDGWQSVAGDWLTPHPAKFPDGMKPIAEAIRAAGCEPGLWIAPLMVSESSVLAREHVDWLLKDDRGEVVTAYSFAEDSHWRGRQFVLDVTHPDAAEHLRKVVRTLTRDWGFGCLKADFLYVGARPGVRHDPAMTRCQAMRRALEILRDELGRRPLLACGCPIGPAVGLADANRTSGDVGQDWPRTGSAIRNVIARYWHHGRLYLADPDVAMVREQPGGLTLAETESLLTVVALSGGLAFWSDQLADVSDDRAALIDRILPPWPVAARPVDLFRRTGVSTLHWSIQQGEAAWHVVALVNLSDTQAALTLQLSDLGLPAGRPWHAFELWQERYHGTLTDERVFPAVPAHGARLVALRPATGGLDFLGSTLHVTMDAVFCRVRPSGLACDVELVDAPPRRGRLFLAAPEGYVVRSAAGLLTERADGSWSIEVDNSAVRQYHLEAIHEPT